MRMKCPTGYMDDPKQEKAQKKQDSDMLLATVGLAKVRDSYVGDALTRGISGGQKRRLTLCKGLVTNPTVVFMDEPTSGLSSSDSELVIKACKLIAKYGSVTFVVVIHQPRYSLFKLFDHVMLMCEGRTIYNGANAELDGYFERLGFVTPAGENPADFFLDIITPGVRGSQPERLMDEWERGPSRGVLEKVERSFGNELGLPPIEAQQDAVMQHLPRQTKQVNQSFLKQYKLLQGRELRLMKRNWDETLVGLLNAAFLGFIIGAIYLDTRNKLGSNGLADTSIQYQLGFLFTIAMTASFLCFGNLPIFINERIVFLNERAEGLYTTFPYMLTKFLTRFFMGLLQILVITLISYFMAGFPGGSYPFFFLAIFSAFFAVDGILACISCMAPSHEVANVFAATILTVSSLFNGFTANSNSSPGWIIWVQYLSCSYYSFLGPCINLFEHYDGFPWDCSIPQSTPALQDYCDNLGQGLSEQYSLNSGMMWPSVFILWAFGISFWIIGLVWQHTKVKLKK